MLAVGAGLGTFFLLGGPSSPRVPAAYKSRILERARQEGVISGYELVRVPHGSFDYRTGYLAYRALDGQIQLRSYGNGCGGFGAGPQCIAGHELLAIEYRHEATDQAQAIYRIAQEQFPNANIKFFEVTPLTHAFAREHIPDSRIMLIPKAGS